VDNSTTASNFQGSNCWWNKIQNWWNFASLAVARLSASDAAGGQQNNT
jgi:hypothetical protein